MNEEVLTHHVVCNVWDEEVIIVKISLVVTEYRILPDLLILSNVRPRHHALNRQAPLPGLTVIINRGRERSRGGEGRRTVRVACGLSFLEGSGEPVACAAGERVPVGWTRMRVLPRVRDDEYARVRVASLHLLPRRTPLRATAPVVVPT